MTHRQGADRLSHIAFVSTLLVKGALGVTQIATAIAIGLGITDRLPAMARWFFANELAEDARDPIALKVIALADRLPGSDTTFYAIYFTAHGALHLGVVVTLLMGLMWSYPAAMLTLAGFIVYQTVEWFAVGGWLLWVLSAIDAVVIGLTWHEWRVRMARQAAPAPQV